MDFQRMQTGTRAAIYLLAVAVCVWQPAARADVVSGDSGRFCLSPPEPPSSVAWGESGTFCLNSADHDWVVSPSASYDPDNHLLRVTVRAYDRTTGLLKDYGTASYRLNSFPAEPLQYSAGRWRATKTVGLAPGTHTVTATVGTTTQSCTFEVVDNSGSVLGTVVSEDGTAVTGATARLYGAVDYYKAGAEELLSLSIIDGTFRLSGLEPGWYIIEAEAPGYLSGRSVAFEVKQGSSKTCNIMLAEKGESLSKLVPQMATLQESVYSTMEFETELMSQLTVEANQDLWDIFDPEEELISFVGDVLNPAGAAFKAMAVKYTIQKLTSLASNAYIALKGGLAEQSVEDLKTFECWKTAESELTAEHEDFVLNSRNTLVADEFNFDAAVRMIRGQSRGVEGVRQGNMPMTIPVADPEGLHAQASLPSGIEAYIESATAMKRAGASAKLMAEVETVAGASSMILAPTGLGGVFARVIYTGASAVKTYSSSKEATAKAYASVAYVACDKSWPDDILSLPGVYLSAQGLLKQEALVPRYFKSSNTYSVDANLQLADTKETTGSIEVQAVPPGLITVLPALKDVVEWKRADITVTNTGNVPSTIRVKVNGYTHKEVLENLPEFSEHAFPLLSKVFGRTRNIRIPFSSACYKKELAPQESYTFETDFVMAQMGAAEMLSGYLLEVDVYSGPFLCDTIRRELYTEKDTGPFSAELDGQQIVAETAPAASFRDAKGWYRTMDNTSFEAMLPTTQNVISGNVDATSEFLSQSYTVGDNTWSVEFNLYGDVMAETALQVFDQDGFCVGYVPGKGGAINEFVGEYSGAGGMQQTVLIPDAAGKTYTVKAVLLASDVEGPFEVELTATEVPIRPAVLAITPSSYSVSTRPGRNVTVPLNVGEASHQQPLTELTITPEALTHTDGLHTLGLESADVQSLGIMKAGASDFMEFTFVVPEDAYAGTYNGQVTVTTASAGSQSLPISVFVAPLGDANADCSVNIIDLIYIRNRLNADVNSGDNWQADVNGDGKINIIDLIYVRNRLNAHCQ